jgi:hypothetical protein
MTESQALGLVAQLRSEGWVAHASYLQRAETGHFDWDVMVTGQKSYGNP